MTIQYSPKEQQAVADLVRLALDLPKGSSLNVQAYSTESAGSWTKIVIAEGTYSTPTRGPFHYKLCLTAQVAGPQRKGE